MEGVGVGGDMLVALMLPARCHSKCSTSSYSSTFASGVVDYMHVLRLVLESMCMYECTSIEYVCILSSYTVQYTHVYDSRSMHSTCVRIKCTKHSTSYERSNI